VEQLFRGSFVAALILIAASSVTAQQRTGAISGTITDETGGAAVQVHVNATNVRTGVIRSATTDASGVYRLPLLEVGAYEVDAAMEGFKTSKHADIVVELDREVVVDHVLTVGARTESVVVSGEAYTIEAAPSAMTNLVDSTAIEELPLNGRDYIQLATLQAGAPVQRAQVRNENTGFGLQISISGARPTQNNFQLDGVSLVTYNGSTPGSINGVNLGVDAVEEFSVHSSAFSAQYGRASGGIVNAVTRSGGNDFHGSAFYFHRNDNLDARNFFDGDAPPEFRRHQFGGSIGGPIKRNKTFFFANYEGLRQARGNTTINTTFSEAARRGELTSGQVQVDEVMANKVLPLYPLPNGEVLGDTGLFIFSNDVVGDEDSAVARVDQNLGDSDKLFFRFSYSNGARANETNFALGVQNSSTKMYSGVAEYTHIFSPNVINSTRFGFLRTETLIGDTVSQVPGTDDPSLSFLPTEVVIGEIVADVVSDFTGGTGALDVDDHTFTSFQPSTDLTWLKGKHSIKIGARFERTHFDTDSQNTSSGEYQYRGMANFLMNLPRRFRAQMPGSDTLRHHRQWIGALYAQDTWRVTNRFTLDFGVRWEWTTVPTEIDGKISNLDNLWDTEMRVGDPLFNNPSWNNIAPRVGLAWDVFGNGKTTVRSGYGIYHDLILSHNLIVAAVRNPPFYERSETRNLPAGSLPKAGYEAIVEDDNPRLRVERFPRDTSQPYVQQWNFNIEQTLDANHTFRVGYVGSHGLNLVSMVEDANLATPITLDDGRLFFPEDGEKINSVFGRIRDRRFEAHTFYHALNTRFQRRFSEGLLAQVSYSYSKSIDDNSTYFSTSEGANAINLPLNNSPRFNRGLSAQDVRHYFVANAVWELPIQDGPGWRRVLGGWQMSGIFTYASGLPTTARIAYDAARTLTSQDDDSGQRPDLVAGRSNNPVTGDPNGWVDVTAFAPPQAGFLGNVARNTVIGPDLATMDFSLVKRFMIPKLGDGGSIDFRFEAFNLFNRANFDLPHPDRMAIFNADGVAEDAGRITSAGLSRELQFGLKLRF
jgi:carboxypeptidase family protein/TonB-dependent receptor-like protein